MIALSYLYVPGDRPDRFGSAVASGAGAVIFDLEDAVAVAAKDGAREAVVGHLQNERPSTVEQWVRINSGGRAIDDLWALRGLPGLDGLVVPKASPASLGDVARELPSIPLLALVESAAAVLELPAICRAANVAGLAMGEVDLVADLGIAPSEDERKLWPFRMQVVAASAATGCRPPVGPVSTAIDDAAGLRASTEALRRAGFASRQAIHPKQVPVINEAMAPAAEEVDSARRLLQRAAAADGGVWVDDKGRMIDEAVLRTARRIVAAAPPPLQA